MDVDILVTGHTHEQEVFEKEGRWFVNPGSVTGAFTPTIADVTPSFMALAIRGNTANAFIYKLKGDEVDVSFR